MECFKIPLLSCICCVLVFTICEAKPVLLTSLQICMQSCKQQHIAWQQLSLPCMQSCIYAKLRDFECDWCASLFRSHTVLINSKRVGLPVWYTDWTIAWKYVYNKTHVTHWSPTHLVVMHTRTSAHDWITYQLLNFELT